MTDAILICEMPTEHAQHTWEDSVGVIMSKPCSAFYGLSSIVLIKRPDESPGYIKSFYRHRVENHQL